VSPIHWRVRGRRERKGRHDDLAERPHARAATSSASVALHIATQCRTPSIASIPILELLDERAIVREPPAVQRRIEASEKSWPDRRCSAGPRAACAGKRGGRRTPPDDPGPIWQSSADLLVARQEHRGDEPPRLRVHARSLGWGGAVGMTFALLCRP
jgi:hypothetical protein